MMSIFELRKNFLAALVLAVMALAILPACSSTSESSDDGTSRDELCDEADAGLTECPN